MKVIYEDIVIFQNAYKSYRVSFFEKVEIESPVRAKFRVGVG